MSLSTTAQISLVVLPPAGESVQDIVFVDWSYERNWLAPQSGIVLHVFVPSRYWSSLQTDALVSDGVVQDHVSVDVEY